MYLNCYNAIEVGDYLKYHITGSESGVGPIDENMTESVVSMNATAYKDVISYDGTGLGTYVEYSSTNLTDNWATGLQDS